MQYVVMILGTRQLLHFIHVVEAITVDQMWRVKIRHWSRSPAVLPPFTAPYSYHRLVRYQWPNARNDNRRSYHKKSASTIEFDILDTAAKYITSPEQAAYILAFSTFTMLVNRDR